MTIKELKEALSTYSEDEDVLISNSGTREMPKNIIQIVEMKNANAENITPVIII